MNKAIANKSRSTRQRKFICQNKSHIRKQSNRANQRQYCRVRRGGIFKKFFYNSKIYD